MDKQIVLKMKCKKHISLTSSFSANGLLKFSALPRLNLLFYLILISPLLGCSLRESAAPSIYIEMGKLERNVFLCRNIIRLEKKENENAMIQCEQFFIQKSH